MHVNLRALFTYFWTDESPIKWGLGFIGEAEEPEGGVEWEEMQRSGYHSATTEIISDSEDDLFFLDGQ